MTLTIAKYIGDLHETDITDHESSFLLVNYIK